MAITSPESGFSSRKHNADPDADHLLDQPEVDKDPPMIEQDDDFSDGESSESSDSSVSSDESSESSDLSSASIGQASEQAPLGKGKGGRAGGALTYKNVPYTRGGDKGTSQLFTGERRSKDDVLFDALGTVDELCSVVGVVYAELIASREKGQSDNSANDPDDADASPYGDLPDQLLDVMSRLFDLGSHVATPPRRSTGATSGLNGFHSGHAEVLEEWIDTMTDQLPELTSFILPTGAPASAQLHAARTVCRRAERRMVPLVGGEGGTVDPAALAYVNRLSDYLFTAARYVDYCDGRDEVQYRREGRGNVQRERVVVKHEK